MPAESVIIETLLIGWREFVAGTQAEAAALTELGAAAGYSASNFERASAKSFALRQGLFTLRRVAYAGTLALLAAGVAAVRLGFRFDQTMQAGRVSMQGFLGSTAAANKELNKLYYIAAYTPFQFQDIVLATRRLIPFTHNIGEANTLMASLTDSLSAMGITTTAALNRGSVALAHMLSSGRVTGLAINQLTRDNIPLLQALAKYYGVTTERIREMTKAGLISADIGAKALNQYVATTKGYTNASINLATRTLVGAWSTFQDLLSQAMGNSEKGVFGGIQRVLARIDKALLPFTKRGRQLTITDFAKAIDQAVSPRSHLVLQFFMFLEGTMQGVVFIFKTLIWMLRTGERLFYAIGRRVFDFLGPLQGLIKYLPIYTNNMGDASTATRILGIVLGLYLGSLIVWRFWLIAAAIAGHMYEIAQWAAWIAIRAFYLAEAIATGLTWLYVAAQIALGGATEFATAAFWSLTAAMLANPFGLLAVALALVVGGLIVLYVRWKWFHNLINNIFGWIVSHWKLLLGIMISPLAVAVYFIIKHFDDIKQFVLGVVRAIANAFKWLGSELLRFWHHIPGHGLISGIMHVLPGLAAGGTVTAGGAVVVGERGPELLHLPRGATVNPTVNVGAHGASLSLNQSIRIYLDGHELTRSVATIVTDKEARK